MLPVIDFLNSFSLRIKKMDKNNKVYFKYTDDIPIVVATFPWNIKKSVIIILRKNILLYFNVYEIIAPNPLSDNSTRPVGKIRSRLLGRM